MTKKMRITLILSLVIIVAAFTVCNPIAAPKVWTLGVIQMTQDIPVQIAMNGGMDERAAELGNVKIVALNGNMDVATQINGIENFIQQKVDAIILNPADADSIVNGVKAANAAGIPVFTFDTNANGGEVISFIESDNGAAGRLNGEYMAWRLKGKGNVAILDLPSVSCVRVRTDNWKAVMKAYPDIKVVQTEIAASVPDGLKMAENILQAHPDLDAFFAINDPGGLGAAQAIKAAGLQDKIFVAAVDGDPKAVEMIAAGDIYGFTACQFGAEIGRVACQTAYDYLNGEKVPSHILIPVMPVTIENYKKYPGWKGALPAEEDLLPAWGK